ncbi:MAG: Coenzyme A biosynthesis bifunctional protein CoaBC [Planctomycetes bacterium ADurb.Bin401]|nr:MAG: Coenzyme A biosynthesis bifunctional protein CoaBC [Planctomycetes bacterium ADurb.Bin401]
MENKSAISDLKILLGVSGGVAVYKAVDLASKLTAKGAQVHTIMTENALKFVLPKSFEAVTSRPVHTSMWDNVKDFEIGHISLAQICDLVVVAPATANIIGKMACGICDDLLSTTLCACWQKKLLLAPAMNDKMWTNPSVQRNIESLKAAGVSIIGPEKGRLACGTEGVGRMSEPADIVKRLEQMMTK